MQRATRWLTFLIATAALGSGCPRLRSARTEARVDRAIVSGDWKGLLAIAKPWHDREPGNMLPALLMWEACLRLDDMVGLESAEDALAGNHLSHAPDFSPLVPWAHALTQGNPDSAAAWQVASEGFGRAGRAHDAVRDAATATRLHPKDWASWLSEGRARLQASDYAGAMDSLNRCLALRPSDAFAYYARSMTDEALGRSDDALADANRAVALAPKASWAYMRRADAYLHELSAHKMRKEDVRKAVLADVARAIQLDPENPDPYRLRVNAYLGAGETKIALPDQRAAVALTPWDPRGHLMLGEILASEGERQEASAEYRKTVALLGHPTDADDFTLRGRANAMLGEEAKAVADLTEAVRLDPRAADAYGSLAVLYLDSGDLTRVIDNATHAIALQPKDAHAYGARGLARLAKGDHAGAVADFTRVIDLPRTYLTVAGYCDRALAYEAEGKPGLAKADLAKAEKLAPGRSKGILENDRRALQRLKEEAGQSQ